MKVSRIGLCVTVCCLTVLSFGRFSSVAQPLSAISGNEESRLLGASGGPATACTGAGTCMACIPTAGCTAFPGWLGMAISGYCGGCTTAGMNGCTTAAAFSVCAPTPGGTCTTGGGAAACGTWDTPVTPIITAGACPATPCKTGAAGSPYCVNCI